jgi:DNA-binding winged helix-turn-helix (wHTH) protein/tetratricopeptide (TPR) repeat protein
MNGEVGRRGGLRTIGDTLSVAKNTGKGDAPELYEFGPFRLEPNERKLSRGNQTVALTPKSFDTLHLLVRNSGHLLEKDELIRMLWPDTFVEEGCLSNNIFLLRKALGDDSEYIETVPRRGYRFVGSVRVLPNTDAAQEAAAERTGAPRRHALTRLIVLPFRILRPNEASDFLSISLPDAITNSLAAVDSLVVRSTMAALRFTGREVNVTMIAEQAQVDAILTGTILSDGENLRITSQLVEAPDGTLLWSNTSKVPLRDIFQLQDDLVDRIVKSLALPLNAREHRALKHDVPASALAYEFYLRANQLVTASYDIQNMRLARELYLRSIELDPNYSPAWACLGRAHHYIAKFSAEDDAVNLSGAEEAFEKAFQLNPNLALAHNFYTSPQTDSGRSIEAMERLLKRAQTHRNDPNLFTGLVQACRYCDLLEASVAAHNRARQLDPQARTSVAYSYLHLGNFQKALDYCPSRTDGFIFVPCLLALGREQDLITLCLENEKTLPQQYRSWPVAVRAYLDGDLEKSRRAYHQALRELPMLSKDPEACFCIACLLARVNDTERALEFLSLALESGYRCHHALLHHPGLESLRTHSRFAELVSRAAEMSIQARTVFVDNGGDRLLGVQATTVT